MDVAHERSRQCGERGTLTQGVTVKVLIYLLQKSLVGQAYSLTFS